MDDARFVTCKNDGRNESAVRITQISMYGNNLRGSLPESLNQFTELSQLSVLENDICGQLPSSLCSLNNLQYLRVGGLNTYGKMHGGIPSCLFEHTGMKGLWLRNTQLGGSAPATFSSGLIELGLEGNNLTGMLPAFNYSQFTFHCNLGHNSFACPLPAGVSEVCEAY